MSEWRIQGGKHPYIIRGSHPYDEFLCPNGEIHKASQQVEYYFNSVAHAENFIKEWEKKMNKEEVKKRIENAEKELAEAKKELENFNSHKIRFGDVYRRHYENGGTGLHFVGQDKRTYYPNGDWANDESVQEMLNDGRYEFLYNVFEENN